MPVGDQEMFGQCPQQCALTFGQPWEGQAAGLDDLQGLQVPSNSAIPFRPTVYSARPSKHPLALCLGVRVHIHNELSVHVFEIILVESLAIPNAMLIVEKQTLTLQKAWEFGWDGHLEDSKLGFP